MSSFNILPIDTREHGILSHCGADTKDAFPPQQTDELSSAAYRGR
jgi:hypothetical protein